MRYGVIADIHANLHALRIAVGRLEQLGVDRYLVAGDLVGYGPHPNECVELVAGLDAVCVAGNHDLIALGRLSDERCVELARASLRWTRGVLGHDAREFLASLPLNASTTDGIALAHGSLHDPQEYTTRPAQARTQLARVVEELPGTRVLVLGHTHRAWAYGRRVGSISARGPAALPDEEILLNPGSAGQSRERRARARCVLLDMTAGAATFFALRYDLEACRAVLRERGLSPRSCHLRPSLAVAGRRAARQAASRLLDR